MELLAILGLSVEELKVELTKCNLATTGLKQEMQERLIIYYQHCKDGELTAENDAQTVIEEEEHVSRRQCNSHFTLRDIEKSMEPFSGTKDLKVKKWVQDLEEVAITLGWNAMQKFVYGKQLLRGAAKLFVRGQPLLRDWHSLKEALLSEFDDEVSSAEVHDRLRRRRKKPSETLQEYLYNLIEIGNSMEIDDASIIRYFVEGIPDSRNNKSNLYQTKTLKELKSQLKIYEEICGFSHQYSNSQTSKISNFGARQQTEDKVCFKCGKKGHLANVCRNSSIVCFKCNKEGHKSFQCKQPTKTEVTGRNSQVMTLIKTGMLFKEIICENTNLQAILDTGCEVCLIRNDKFHKIKGAKIIKEKIRLTGVGGVQIMTMGYFITNIIVDNINLQVKFHVVQENDMSFEAVLGTSILQQVNVLVTSEGAKLEVRGEKTLMENTESEKEETVDTINNEPKDRNLLLKEFKSMCLEIEGKDTEKTSEVDFSHLSKPYKEEILALINNYQPTKDRISPIEMKIIVKDDQPVYQRPRRVSYVDQQSIDNQVAEWLKDGIIRPSVSEYASPIVLVKKKDGTKRMCCDFRKINEKIMRDNFPMPLIDDVVERLQKAKVFTTMDLKDGFFHVPIEKSSSKYTAFVTHSGQYEFNYVPFGICNSPAVFTRFMMAVFRNFIQDGTIVIYMDDMIIPTSDEKDGIIKLRRVLDEAATYGLKIKWKKCQFLLKRVNFLGYIIEGGSIKPSKEKMSAVMNFPLPATKQAVQRFVGLTSYFRRFIEGYALIAKPLTDMIKKDVQFIIKDEQILAFEQLKTMLVKAPILKIFDHAADTEIHTDACKYGYGGVLLQKDSEDQLYHPVQYMSRKTKPSEEKLTSYELEVLAVIEALKKWRVYVMGKRFKIITDCNAFAMTMRKQDIPPKVARWAMFLQEFDYVIEHRVGTKMKHVDALSRVYCLILENSLTHRLREAQLRDPWVKAVRSLIENNSNYEDYYMKFGILYKDPAKELIVVPTEMENEIINIAHRQGHFATKKTQDLIEKNYYIPALNGKVAKVVRSCVACIISDGKQGKNEGLLTPIDKGDRPLLTYHIDHVGPMDSTTKNYKFILAVIDGFSKFVWLYPTKSTGTDEVLRSLEKQAVVFGNPARIITDRGTAFTSTSFESYCDQENIQHLLIATGMPRGNGQVERVHRVVVPMLAKLCHENPTRWYKHINKIQQFLNNTPPRSTNKTPFQILTGLKMRITDNPTLHNILEEENLKQMDEELEKVRREARENIAIIQNENRKSFNKGRKLEEEHKIGDLVAIKRTQFGTNMKLRPKYLGPYKIIGKLNHGRYKLEKIGQQEGPIQTIGTAENIKKM